MQPCNRNILEALKLACRLNLLADKGEEDSEDDSCSVLYGVVRDCAYRIRERAEAERRAHILAGRWDEDDDQITISTGLPRIDECDLKTRDEVDQHDEASGSGNVA